MTKVKTSLRVPRIQRCTQLLLRHNSIMYYLVCEARALQTDHSRIYFYRFNYLSTAQFPSWSLKILANNQLDALFHVFILFHVSICFERHSAHHQEIELY
jgi:hypothetical protein